MTNRVKGTRFQEIQGGEIIGPNGDVVCRVMVADLLTGEAHNVVKCIVDALDKEFPE